MSPENILRSLTLSELHKFTCKLHRAEWYSRGVMKDVTNFSDAEIDALLLHLFNGSASFPTQSFGNSRTSSHIRELSNEDLLRIRSKNHPDKWPNTNQSAYQAAVEELDRRRHLKKRP